MYNSKQRNALVSSISYWEEIVACKKASTGRDGCPLCLIFMETNCQGCPIYISTGKVSCSDTPYNEFYKYAKKTPYFGVAGKVAVSDYESKKLAVKMLDYLKKLLDADTVTYSIGDRFRRESSEYILAANATGEACLIDLETGARWEDGANIDDIYKIDQNNFYEKICRGFDFTRIFS